MLLSGDGFFSSTVHVLAVAIASAGVLVVASLVLTLTWCRWRYRRSKGGYLLINEKQPLLDYGSNQSSTLPDEELTHSLLSPVSTRVQKGKNQLYSCLMGEPRH